ncbi:MAG: hypothetical protein AAFV95_04430 [Bacteroidota bacterium]
MKTTTSLIFTFCLAIFAITPLQAQLAINSDGSLPDSSAMLDISSTDKGFLIPRLTTTQRNNISNPASGLLVYDSNQQSFWYFNGTDWKSVVAAPIFLAENNTTKANGNDNDWIVGANNLDYNGTNDRKMFFDKSLGAFRVGRAYPSTWDESFRGRQSFASNFWTTASGQFSVAMGTGGIASGNYSVKFGQGAEATEDNDIAFGVQARAKGPNAVSIGAYSDATNVNSVAIGLFANASGRDATSFLRYTKSTNSATVAIGYHTEAHGKYAVSMGRYSQASSYGELAIGNANTIDTAAKADAYVSSDRLFVVGNSHSNFVRSDAMIVYKNGNTKINGDLEVNELKGSHVLTNLNVSNQLQFGSSDKFKLDEGSWQTGNIALTSGSGTFGFYSPGIHQLHLRTDGNATVDGSIQVGAGTTIRQLQSGQHHVGTYSSGSGAKTVTINFGHAFSSTPMILVTPQEVNGGYNDVFITTIKSISPTSVTLNVYRIDSPGIGWGQQLKLNWMAWN